MFFFKKNIGKCLNYSSLKFDLIDRKSKTILSFACALKSKRGSFEITIVLNIMLIFVSFSGISWNSFPKPIFAIYWIRFSTRHKLCDVSIYGSFAKHVLICLWNQSFLTSYSAEPDETFQG